MRPSDLRVLTYHRVVESGAVPAPNPTLVSASPSEFERQMRHLARRYRVVSLAEALEAQRGGAALPGRAVLLTFDDGYRDFGEIVWPILSRYRLPATVFVPTAYPDDPERMFWWDRVHHAVGNTRRSAVTLPMLGTLRLDTPAARAASLLEIQYRVKRIPHARAMALVDQLCADLDALAPPTPRVLGWDQLRELAREGVSLVPHTRSHPALTQLDVEAMEREIRGSMDDLRAEIGDVLPAFCYPFGLQDDRAVEAVRRQGIEMAFTCLDGQNEMPAADPLRLRRTSITRRTSGVIFGMRLWKPISYVDTWRHQAADAEAERRGSSEPEGRTGANETKRPDGPGDAGEANERRDRSVAISMASTSAGDTFDQDPIPRIAYIMSRFPKLSETFVLNEILSLEALGIRVEVYPLLRERQAVTHPEVERLVRRAHFHPFVSLPILRAQAHFLRRQPRAYLGTLFTVLGKAFGSANFFVGALGIFPKSVRFAYEMRGEGVTHVHAHFCNHPAVAAWIVHRLTGIPFSFTAHGSDLHVERRMLDAKVDASAFAVTVSAFNREVMITECGERARDKIHVIRCGVDPDLFVGRRGKGEGAPFRIVCVASLEEVKGHRYLVEACRILRSRGRDLRCDMVGDGPRRRDVEARIERAGLRDHIRLHGAQPRQEVATLLSGADVAVLASHPTRDGKREGIPVALMEAMASGLPVVASAISGIPELVEDEVTGLLVPSGDPVAIADALERLIEDPELRRRMGAAGREKVLREFELGANTRSLLRLFRVAPADLARTTERTTRLTAAAV